MSWPDQSQHRSGIRSTWNRMRLWPLVYWIILVNVVVYVADVLSGQLLSQWGWFSAATLLHGQVWRLITSQFLHANVLHLLFNMLTLGYFGTYAEAALGRRRFLAFYLLCGICGALFYILLWRMQLLNYHAETPMVGASGAIFGVLVAAAHIVPRLRINFMFPPVSMQLRTMVWIFLGVAVMMIIERQWNAGGEAAHLGGALGGWILYRNRHWLGFLVERPKRATRFWKPGDPPDKFFRNS